MEKKAKKVTITPKTDDETQKLTYEQLEQVANNLNVQCKQLYQRCQAAEQTLASFNEVGMLLDVLGKSTFFTESFIERCSQTIEKIISAALDEAEKGSEEKAE